MNQKPNALVIDLKIHFESPLEAQKIIRWMVPLAFALIQLLIRLHGGS